MIFKGVVAADKAKTKELMDEVAKEIAEAELERNGPPPKPDTSDEPFRYVVSLSFAL